MGTPTDRVTPAIRLEDVSVSVGHDRTTVLSGVTLDVGRHEVLAIVGRSGAGKSTLLKVLAGITDISGGTIVHDSAVGPQRTALVFQEPLLLPWLTAVDNVAFSMRLRSHPHRSRRRAERRARAMEVLERLGMADLADRYPSELSGGQQQRVAIARAVSAQPDVLLLDEPFSALDLATRTSLQDWIVDHRESLASSIVLVTHDLAEALYVADRIALITAAGDSIKPGGAEHVPVWTSDVEDRWQLQSSAVRSEMETYFLVP